ncbi:MAG TPA: ribonuclease G, partial [Myxococcaceae bacterium]
MGSILLINAAGRETRVALVENGHIAEFYLERKKDKGVVGNIYKGRVVRVLPGMQAAFVDIGLDKAAFLYVSDVVYDPDFARAQFELTEGEHEDAPEVPDELEDNGAPAAEQVVEAPSLRAEVEDADAHADALHEAAHAEAFNEGAPGELESGDDIEDDEADAAEAADEMDALATHGEDETSMTAAPESVEASLGAADRPEEHAPESPVAVADTPATSAVEGEGAREAMPLASPELAPATPPASPADVPGEQGEPAVASPTGNAAPKDRRQDRKGERRAARELRERHQHEKGRDRD